MKNNISHKLLLFQQLFSYFIISFYCYIIQLYLSSTTSEQGHMPIRRDRKPLSFKKKNSAWNDLAQRCWYYNSLS